MSDPWSEAAMTLVWRLDNDWPYRSLTVSEAKEFAHALDSFAAQRVAEETTNLRQAIKDHCEDDDAIRALVEPIIGTLATHGDGYNVPLPDVVAATIRVLAQRVAEERQACFSVAKNWEGDTGDLAASIANAIRAHAAKEAK